MIRLPKSVVGFLPRLRLLRQLHAKRGRRGLPKSDDDDLDYAVRKKDGVHEQNLYLYKSRGQHILTNPRILNSIVQKSTLNPTDTVLEIGPGTGNLTLKLLETAQKVVAVEIDARMVEILEKRATERGFRDRLMVIRKDALRTEFPQFDLVVANIPYGISSPLIIKLVYGTTSFRSATLLLQKEFARRLLANPGDSEFNRLAVNVKLVANVEFIMDVSKRDFLPCPKVDSSVVIIRPKAQVPDVDLHEWWAFTRTCFSKKNKTLGATFKQKRKIMELLRLSNVEGLSTENAFRSDVGNCSSDSEDEGCCHQGGMCSLKEKIIGVLNTAGFEDKRPSKLSIEELLHLLSLFNQAGIFFHGREKPSNEDSFAIDAD